MIFKKLDIVESYLASYLTKEFIKANLASYLFSVLLLKCQLEEFNFILTIKN